MDIFRAIILGLVQGATEFLPVSSSGHLVIVPWLFGWPASSLLFDTVAHWGTLLAIVLVFWRDLWTIFLAGLASLRSRSLADPNARLAWYIVVGSIPAAAAGLLFKDFLEGLFASPQTAGVALLGTAGLLAGSEMLASRLRNLHGLERMTWADSLIIGFAQMLALIPGISRSGSTIAAGLSRGLDRAAAARYSFLLGTPAFLGAGLLTLSDALATDPSQLVSQIGVMVVGFIVSAVTGYLAVNFLLAYLRRHNLYLFALYCAGAGAAVLILAQVGWGG